MNWQKLQNLKGYGDVKQYVTTLENDAEDVAKKLQKILANNPSIPEDVRKELECVAVDIANIPKNPGFGDVLTAYKDLDRYTGYMVDSAIMSAANIKEYNNRKDISTKARKQAFNSASVHILDSVYPHKYLFCVMSDAGMEDPLRCKILTDILGKWQDILVGIIPRRSTSFSVCLGAEKDSECFLDRKGVYLQTDNKGNFEKIQLVNGDHYLELFTKKWTMVKTGCCEVTTSKTWYITEGTLGAVARIYNFDLSPLMDMVSDPFGELTQQDASLIGLAFPDIPWDTALFDDFRSIAQEIKNG